MDANQPDIVANQLFSKELLALKNIIDGKINCQATYTHKTVNKKWFVNTGLPLRQGRKDMRPIGNWEECANCNI